MCVFFVIPRSSSRITIVYFYAGRIILMFLFCLRTLRRANDTYWGKVLERFITVTVCLRVYAMLTTFHAVEGSSNYLAPTAFLEYGFPSTRRACHRKSIEHIRSESVWQFRWICATPTRRWDWHSTFEPPDNSAIPTREIIDFFPTVRALTQSSYASARRVAWIWRQLSARMRALMNETKNIWKSLIEQLHEFY